MNDRAFFIKISLFIFVLIQSISSCKKEEIDEYNYKVIMKGDLKDLVIINYGKNIYGIDTANFQIKAHIVVDDMAFGGVAKLNNEGLVFTHNRRVKNNAWGKSMYIVNNQCEIIKKMVLPFLVWVFVYLQ